MNGRDLPFSRTPHHFPISRCENRFGLIVAVYWRAQAVRDFALVAQPLARRRAAPPSVHNWTADRARSPARHRQVALYQRFARTASRTLLDEQRSKFRIADTRFSSPWMRYIRGVAGQRSCLQMRGPPWHASTAPSGGRGRKR